MSAVIPAPLSVSPRAEPSFALGLPWHVLVPHESLRSAAELFAADLAADTGLAVRVRIGAGPAAPGERAVVLELRDADEELAGLPAALGLSPHGGDPAAERYGLEVTGQSVLIWATAEEGLGRGLTTLRQLAADAAGAAGLIAAQRIIDGPRFAWRGLSLDVARTFFPVEQVEQVIDMLAAYKLNVLHLHLTDDAGWRLDVPGKPRLAEVGGAHALGERPGGWYSTADFERLAGYGARRHVTVVPEIDLPGHATALLRAYPELTAAGTAPEHPDGAGIPMAAVDLAVPGTAEFVDDVLAQVAALSAAPFLHIGGDETFGLSDEASARFVDHAAATVRGLGKRVVGWQEIARAGIGDGDVIQFWFDRADEFAAMAGAPAGGAGADGDSAGGDGGDRAAALAALGISPEVLPVLAAKFAAASGDVARAVGKGASVLLSPTKYTYLDVPYAEPSADPEQEEARKRVGMPMYPTASVRDVLAWDPEELLAGTAPRERLAGVEAALWCETVTDAADAHFLLLPRLPGIAEKAWSPASRSWDEYRQRLSGHGRTWQHRGWGFFRSSLIDWA
jgi:hexosaminidase